MALDIVLNDLSFTGTLPETETRHSVMTKLTRAITEIRKHVSNPSLRVPENFLTLDIHAGYTFQDWKNDQSVDQEEKRRVFRLSTMSPIWSNPSTPKTTDQFWESEFTYNEKRAIGLGYSYLDESIALSILSSPHWDTHSIRIKYQYINETFETEDDYVNVNHCSQAHHVKALSQWISSNLQMSVLDGKDAVTRKSELFPNLVFCQGAENTLESLGHGNVLLEPVIKRLALLELYCKSWNAGPFSGSDIPMKISGESEATMRKYSAERTFVCPDGMTRTFELHARLTPLSWRVHFFPIPENREIIIGYIGSHLRTANHSN